MRPLRPVLLAALAFSVPVLGADRKLIASFDDPAGDANGPGYYEPPGDTDFLPGDFDLRQFQVYEEGDKVVFEVTMAENFRYPPSTQRYNSTPLDLNNNIYMQNIDIYVDTDQTPGSGYSVCIPGRRVAFADGRTWEYAVVLTPQPGPARSVTQGVLGEAARRVLFPENLQSQGKTIIARIPWTFFGGHPTKEWGYSVHVSGARWERSFSVVDRLAGRHEADAYTMPVIGVREAWMFGGAPMGKAHPFVVDVLLPPGVSQAKVLGSFDTKTGAYAKVPFVYGSGVAPPPEAEALAEKPAAPTLTVADVSSGVVSIKGPSKGVGVMQIGKVLGPDGAAVGRVIVTQVIEGGVVGRAVEGGDAIRPGMGVEFSTLSPGQTH
ncbi:MAG TPA: glucodextranase DOMON-like domain-containing protein [Myxococcaceae bacterium]|nr:glucodextranase DOMON-like domain-containing protein [Myxococcaceae bacterium]